jgi:hypothetical protein
MNILEALKELENGKVIRYERRPGTYDEKDDIVRYYLQTETIPFEEKSLAYVSISQDLKSESFKLSDLDYSIREHLPQELVKCEKLVATTISEMLAEIVEHWKKKQSN